MIDEPEIDYRAMDAAKLRDVCGDDYRLWAQAFMQIMTHRTKVSGENQIDEELMRKWFANVIEAASMKREKALREKIEKLERKLTDLGSNANLDAYD